jgi:hypothetical protein
MSQPPPPDRHRDRGSAAAISIAIVFPAVTVLVLALAQAAMVAAARAVALASAEEGLRIARARSGTPTRGDAAATSFAARQPVLLTPTIFVSGTTTITVTVHGYAPSLLPGVHLAVSGTARGPHERLTTESRGSTTRVWPPGPARTGAAP